jgi:hypothetical protein
MAEQKPAERPAQQPEPKKEQPKSEPEPAALGSAGASANPLVHQLLAERNIMASVDDKDAVKALDKRLADLGVSVES